MKNVHYADLPAESFDGDQVRGVKGRVAIGRADGAANFCMRVFELASEGYTPLHQHDWEHEIFVHSGQGEVYLKDQWQTVGQGSVVFIPGNVRHQLRNRGAQKLIFVCAVPSGAPEL